MTNSFFNIIIPTKNRANTLSHTIKTLINQNYNNYKIIITDNNSSDNTEELIKKINHQKILYSKSNKDISMSENWERGLDLVEEGFVTILGDDDGLAPNSLNIINDFIKKKNIDIISWQPHTYFWSNFQSEEKNKLILCYPDQNKIINHSSSDLLQQILDMQTMYLHSPMIYNSFVNISLINTIKNKKNNNKFFTSNIPDVYSGLVFLLNTKCFYKLDQPIGINGISKYSGGALFSRKNKTRNEIINFYKCYNINLVPPIPSYYLAMLDPYLNLCKEFKIETRKYLINYYFLKSRVTAEISDEKKEDKIIYDKELNNFIKQIKSRFNFLQKLMIFFSLFWPKKYEISKLIEIKQPKEINNIYDISLRIKEIFEKNINEKPSFKYKIINFLKKTRTYNIIYTIKNIKNLR